MDRKQNKSVIFGKREYDLHLIVKTLLLKKCLEKGSKNVKAEYSLTTEGQQGKIVDVIDFDNSVAYEIERNLTPKYKILATRRINEWNDRTGNNIHLVFIDLAAMPKDITKAIKNLGLIMEAFTGG